MQGLPKRCNKGWNKEWWYNNVIQGTCLCSCQWWKKMYFILCINKCIHYPLLWVINNYPLWQILHIIATNGPLYTNNWNYVFDCDSCLLPVLRVISMYVRRTMIATYMYEKKVSNRIYELFYLKVNWNTFKNQCTCTRSNIGLGSKPKHRTYFFFII